MKHFAVVGNDLPHLFALPAYINAQPYLFTVHRQGFHLVNNTYVKRKQMKRTKQIAHTS
jgi:hypothetical protein